MVKIALTGPESAGKTTLAKSLAQELKANWLPEYARDYLENLNRPYNYNDVIFMAKTQLQKEKDATLKPNKTLVLDTNLLVYKIWLKEKYNVSLEWIEKELLKTKDDLLYVLCDIDIPWEEDKLREHPLKSDRERLFMLYYNYLKKNDFKFIVASGSFADRLKKTLNFVLS